jgi:LVIVD repeat
VELLPGAEPANIIAPVPKPTGLLPFVLAAIWALGASPAFAALDLVGAYDPDTSNASVVALDGTAYLGSWGSEAHCEAPGVRVIDLRDPAAPRLESVAAQYPRTTAEHLAVLHHQTATFSGTLLLAGIQRCAAAGDEGGLALWDVSNPADPHELAFFGVGIRPRGVHEFTVGRSSDRLLAYLAVPNSEWLGGPGDLRILDITDPRQPFEVGNWGAHRETGLPIGLGSNCEPECRGLSQRALLHSVALSPDQRTAYLSYWDLGMFILDVTDPSAPRLLGRFVESPLAEGDTHSVAIARGSIAMVADETFSPPWGRLRMVDVSDPLAPVQIGTWETPDSAADKPGDVEEWYTIHNPYVDPLDPRRAVIAWYSDGVRLLDISNPRAPVELDSWVPPRDAFVWSVAFLDDLILVGDVHHGLYILHR